MENLELFEKYVSNELDDEARRSFQERLADDETFKEEFEIFKEMQSYLEIKDNVDTGIKNIKQAKERYQSNRINGRRFLILSIAASLIIIIALVYNWTNSTNITHESLYAEYFDPEPLSIKTLGSEEEANAESGLELFNQGNYSEAFIQLDTVGLRQRDKGVVLLGKGISALQGPNIYEGRRILEDLATSYPSFANESNFYLALSYLKEGNITSSKLYLQKIPSTSNLSKTIQDLLQKLEKFQ